MDFIYLLIALIVCITVHEAAHAWVAWRLGDPTAKMAGRVTLNPLAHLDVLGTIMIFIAHFGWGKPTPFNYHNLKNPRWDSFLIAIAGPTSNLLTAFVIAFFFKYVPLNGFWFETLRATFSLSIILALFNLIPIAPLDGSKMLGLIVPASKEAWYQDFLQKGPMLLIFLVFGDRLVAEVTGFSFFGAFLSWGFELISFVILLAT